MKSFRKLVLLVVCLLFASLSAPVYSQTVNVSSPGTLKNVAGIKTATQLTLTGEIDASDFNFMCDSIPNLATLDLSGVKIEAYDGPDGTSIWYTSYPANQIPPDSFYSYNTGVSKTSLTSIILPNGITSIRYGAFNGCAFDVHVMAHNTADNIIFFS
jgi:hypothetical protein